jgi:hypothetical protein
MAYLATQASEFQQTGVMPTVGSALITSNYVGVMLQALFMVPVALVLHTIGRQRSLGVSRVAVMVGIVALGGVAVLRFMLLVDPRISDILFMAPMGFVGVWLIAVNWLLAGVLTTPIRVAGTVAGLGLVVLGASFFFLGGLVVLTDGPLAYASDVDFHVGIAIGGLPGLVVFPIWTIFLGGKLLRARDSLDQGPALADVA